MQGLYEKHKAAPPLPRNAPPVAGNIQWSRQLLRRIETPMKRCAQSPDSRPASCGAGLHSTGTASTPQNRPPTLAGKHPVVLPAAAPHRDALGAVHFDPCIQGSACLYHGDIH